MLGFVAVDSSSSADDRSKVSVNPLSACRAEPCMRCAGTEELGNELIHTKGKQNYVVGTPDCSTARCVRRRL